MQRICTISRHLSSSITSARARGVCLVIGAGSGIGAGVAQKFSDEGYTLAIVRRSDETKLNALRDSICDKVGDASACHAYLMDATRQGAISQLVDEIETKIGAIDVAVYNLGANMGFRNIETTTHKVFDRAMKLGAYGAFEMGKSVSQNMKERRRGTIIFTGATAAMRGQSSQHAHSPAMFARRGIAQTLAHELGPQGIHVAHVIVDGMVDAPDTLGKMMPELFEKLKAEKMPKEEIITPMAVADAYWYLHTQPKSSWTFEMDLRPFTDNAWYNS